MGLRGVTWPEIVRRGRTGWKSEVVKIRRCAAVVKGGRRFSFNALVVVGDKQRPGRLRLRQGQRGAARRRESRQGRPGNAEAAASASRCSGETIPHRVIGRFGGSRVILVPAGPGTGVKAGPGVRDVLECLRHPQHPDQDARQHQPASTWSRRPSQGLLLLRTREEVAAAARSDAVMDLTTVHHGVHTPQAQEARRPRHRQRPRQDRHPRRQGPVGQRRRQEVRRSLFEGGQMPLFRRIPKRGFSHATWDTDFHVVNVGDLDEAFDDGDDGRSGVARRPAWPRARPTACASSAPAS